MSSYQEFLDAKKHTVPDAGFNVEPSALSDRLFDFQRDLVRWSLRKGRSALFCDTGLGKTFQQLEWSRHVSASSDAPVLILAPLAVAAQTVHEGERFGIGVTLCREDSDVREGVNITNYDRLERFDVSPFSGVVLDESSCLKDFTSSTRNQLIDTFKDTPYRLACSATPSPNDYTELGNHAEFLGVMSRTEMLATWFVHDGGSTQDWRLKGHAEKSFWKWVCSWSAMVKRPSDLGYPDDGYNLPPLNMHHIIVACDDAMARAAGKLFVDTATTLQEQRAARRASMPARVAACADVVSKTTEPFLVWCELNDESSSLTGALQSMGIDAAEVTGSQSLDVKEEMLTRFSDGRTRVLVTKPSIAGYGMNWQHAHHMAFLGVTHSFEQFYQAVRREWRFGQQSPVECYVITSDAEGAVVANLRRKQADADNMAREMSAMTADIVKSAVLSTQRETDPYEPAHEMTVPSWLKEAS